MSRHPIYPLACPQDKGFLLLTPCPGTKNQDLKASLLHLIEEGARAILTLMQTDEMRENGVNELNDLCKELELDWYHLAIMDEGAPDKAFDAQWAASKQAIHLHLDKKQGVAIHCKGGSGRTGLVAAQILLERGESLANSMERIKQLRPKAFSHSIQVEYLLALANRLTFKA